MSTNFRVIALKVVYTTHHLFGMVALYTDMAGRQQAHETTDNTTNERQKVAGRCRNCGAVYSAWVLSDNTVQPIGKKNGCRCGASEFEAIST